MADNNDDDRKDAKRQKLQSEQRAAYEEDMARINSALRESETSHSSDAAADAEEVKNENSDGNQQEPGESQPQQQPQPQQQAAGEESDDEEEGAGNWLKNFTPHHTRVGSEFQVTELPMPTPSATSRAPAVVAPKQ